MEKVEEEKHEPVRPGDSPAPFALAQQENLDLCAGGLFTLTEVTVNGKKVRSEPEPKLISIPIPTTKKEEDDGSFWKMSPRCIIEKISEAVRAGEKVRFKGVGLESTVYYKKYMSNTEEEDKKEQNKEFAERYFRAAKGRKRVNEHMVSFNRIKDQLRRTAERKVGNLAVVLESNLDTAYTRLERDLNRVNAYQKYSYDIP